MKSRNVRRIAGLLMLGTGVAGTLLFAWGLYMWFAITEMLYFLRPAYGGLVLTIVLFLSSIGLAGFGYVLFSRSRGFAPRRDGPENIRPSP